MRWSTAAKQATATDREGGRDSLGTTTGRPALDLLQAPPKERSTAADSPP